jgi:hypothetical protein
MRQREILSGRSLTGFGVLAVLSSWSGLQAQALRPPSFRPSDAATRTARAWVAIDSIGRPGGVLRRAFVDTAVGLPSWLEFSADALARTTNAPTPENAASRFLDRFVQPLLGVVAGRDLRLVSSTSDGDLTHFRYQQVHSGYVVDGADLRVHVLKTTRGFAVQVVNGRTLEAAGVHGAVINAPEPTVRGVFS